MKRFNECKRTSISTWSLSFNTSLKQMTSFNNLQVYPDWTYWNTFGVMRSAHSREQDFMAIMAEVEVLSQQLKGKGMYTAPPTLSSTNKIKPSNNVHFQPIDPAHKSPVQTMDQSLLNSSLNLLEDLPRLQSSSSNGSIPCGQTTPQEFVHTSNSPIHAPLPHVSQLNVPPTPYVNLTAVNQHMGT